MNNKLLLSVPLLFTMLLIGIFLSSKPAAAAHQDALGHWGHGYVPTVHGPPSISHYAYDAEQTWLRNGYTNGFRVGPFSQTNGSCNPIDGGIVYCVASRAELNGHIGAAQVFTTFNPNRHIDYAIIRICHDCGLTHSQAHRVITHELGHALGLEHNPNKNSVMYFAASSGSPDVHDRDAMCFSYCRRHNEG